MRLLILSDSHKYTGDLDIVIEKLNNSITHVLHLGDCYDDISFSKAKYSKLDFQGVHGNCDFSDNLESEKIIELTGKRIFITHGHHYGVKAGYQRIVYAAAQRHADICLFGHTHMPVKFQAENILFMNPGSIALPRGKINAPSYGILEIGKSITATIVIKQNGVFRPTDSFNL